MWIVAVVLCTVVVYTIYHRRAERTLTAVSPIVVEEKVDDQDSMFEKSSALLSAWSDVFYNFLGIASNDCRGMNISVTPLQDIGPNELA